MTLSMFVDLILILVIFEEIVASPLSTFTSYQHSIELQKGFIDLWWSIDEAEREIVFELHVQTTGWIALGISPGGGMTGADIGVGWVDADGSVHFQDRFAVGERRPIFDNTTIDWFAEQGREENGWTAIRFKRLLNTCDSMDVPIKSGTNIVIFAYGLLDPDTCQSNPEISYHESRRGTRMIPLRSYDNPPIEEKFAHLDSFEFRLNNYQIPNKDTTYFCKVFRIPSRLTEKRHAIGYKILVDSASADFVHHMTTYECDSRADFNENDLPEGECDDQMQKFSICMSNMANGWAVGGDHMVEYPRETGYPLGGDFPVRYYMIQIHYDNFQLVSNHRDNSGIRFYLADELRQYDLGYLTLGTESNAGAIAIPPQLDHFIIDAFCPSKATEKIPLSGITVISAFPHTHLQGTSVSTTLIRQNKAIEYLFNAESFNFNYQFQNQLFKPIKLHRGDAFITRCTYNTMNKRQMTLGGQKTTDEMCLQTFAYYPRLNDLFVCVSSLTVQSWLTLTNDSSLSSTESFHNWLNQLSWTSESIDQWQRFFLHSSRSVYIIGGNQFIQELIDPLPVYENMIPSDRCDDH